MKKAYLIVMATLLPLSAFAQSATPLQNAQMGLAIATFTRTHCPNFTIADDRLAALIATASATETQVREGPLYRELTEESFPKGVKQLGLTRACADLMQASYQYGLGVIRRN